MSKAHRGRKRRKWSNMKNPSRVSSPCSLCGAMIWKSARWPDYKTLCGACERAEKEATKSG